MRPRGVDVVYYNVSDLARAVAFYRDTLGLDVLFSRGLAGFTLFPVAELQAGGTTLALIGTAEAPMAEADPASPWPEHRWVLDRPAPFEPPRGDQRGGATVMLAVDDLAAAVAELRGKGVPVLLEPAESPVCYLAMATDPDGNRVGLHQRKDGTAG